MDPVVKAHQCRINGLGSLEDLGGDHLNNPNKMAVVLLLPGELLLEVGWRPVKFGIRAWSGSATSSVASTTRVPSSTNPGRRGRLRVVF